METSLPTPYLPGSMLIYWRVSMMVCFDFAAAGDSPVGDVPSHAMATQEAADEAEFLHLGFVPVRGKPTGCSMERKGSLKKTGTRMGRLFHLQMTKHLGHAEHCGF